MAKKRVKKKEKVKLDITREQKNLKFSYLRPSLVQYSQVTSVYIEEFKETIYFKSWEELALMLLMVVHDTYTSSFLSELVAQGVLREGLDITSGEFKELGEDSGMRTVGIPGTSFKLRYRVGTGVLCHVITGCGMALGYTSEQFTLNTLPYTNEAPLREVRMLTVTETLGYYRKNILESAEIYVVQFRGEVKKVSNFFDMSLWLLNRVLGEVGSEQLSKFELANTRGLGVTRNPELEVIKIEELKEKGWYMYYNNSKVQTMEYFGKLMELMEIDLDRVKFTVKQLY